MLRKPNPERELTWLVVVVDREHDERSIAFFETESQAMAWARGQDAIGGEIYVSRLTHQNGAVCS